MIWDMNNVPEDFRQVPLPNPGCLTHHTHTARWLLLLGIPCEARQQGERRRPHTQKGSSAMKTQACGNLRPMAHQVSELGKSLHFPGSLFALIEDGGRKEPPPHRVALKRKRTTPWY